MCDGANDCLDGSDEATDSGPLCRKYSIFSLRLSKFLEVLGKENFVMNLVSTISLQFLRTIP